MCSTLFCCALLEVSVPADVLVLSSVMFPALVLQHSTGENGDVKPRGKRGDMVVFYVFCDITTGGNKKRAP